MKTLVFLIVILTSLFQDLNAKACCSNGWIAYNSHCYFVGYEARTFSEAHHFCTQREAYLVRIDDYLENNFLKNMLKRSNVIRAWTGLTDQRAEGFWQWYGTNDHAAFYDWGP
ncbi:perlucin-like protein isoform X2 [Mercenaria mercenaria]|uniref:perlucin-like protein isoform X2 n=1 Tax=Mercenaria mercenaria TaxID=6596 RepID=UPI00234FB4A9|nr:perlucin-like protein isoform X2 [Mercenaria mercenaria]